MPTTVLTLPEETKKELKEFVWVNWSEVGKETLLEKEELEELLIKLRSKEEQEFIKWSVDLGRRAKKETWKRILSELSPKERKELEKSKQPDEEALRLGDKIKADLWKKYKKEGW